MRSNYWSTTYAHDRRKHRHRCMACRCIVNAGEAVLMARVATKVTRVLHADCANKPSTHGFTWRDLLDSYGHAYRVAAGERLPPHPMSIVDRAA